ncbi:MAG: hypothetical protein A2Y00_02430 [Omnitrophica WOR_2 bacterium GWF2_43_52]|nr:MAG: hypothetical protein A2062_03225 [Omnitrophica WOR_2 bacterium GWA2_44_7]OGX14604.1 MAG: hypothetical protein A2Y01_06325 [Omnitrophica WOR_2 bacterium GWC2_44_8]OGX20297.1 MAG: hypothetical protein A2Y00_02430 [Omnitrophica WOR_2 bacterium GWF2_43_52]HAH21273.1 hypothetical protein [Candidatus Omnitrophota bacterium]HBG63915.1 hypothetical protein [Candidatus Omnitrophota bacterium]
MILSMVKIQSLYAVIARLSKREKLVLYGAAFFVSLTVLDRLVVSAVIGKMRHLDAQIKEKTDAARENLKLLARKERIIAETKKYASFLNNEQSREELVTSVLKEVEDLANKSQVYLIDIKPAGFKDSGSIREYTISLNCEAQMGQLVEFMYSIEKSSLLLSIDKYQLSPKAKESSLARCSMSVSKITLR